MTLVILSMMPLLVLVGALLSVVSGKLAARVSAANTAANNTAQQAFQNIRCVAWGR